MATWTRENARSSPSQNRRTLGIWCAVGQVAAIDGNNTVPFPDLEPYVPFGVLRRFFFGGVLHKIHPGRFNGWFTYSHHPWKRKENDLNQNLQGIMFHVNLPGCTQVVHSVRGQAKKMAYLLGNDPHIFYQTFRTFWVDDFPPFSHRECEIS